MTFGILSDNPFSFLSAQNICGEDDFMDPSLMGIEEWEGCQHCNNIFWQLELKSDHASEGIGLVVYGSLCVLDNFRCSSNIQKEVTADC